MFDLWTASERYPWRRTGNWGMVIHPYACVCMWVLMFMHLLQLENTSQQNSANSRSSGIRLPWMCRLSIATDTARGLAYLHTADRQNPLVHRDVKRWDCCTGYWEGGWSFVKQWSVVYKTGYVVYKTGYVLSVTSNCKLADKSADKCMFCISLSHSGLWFLSVSTSYHLVVLKLTQSFIFVFSANVLLDLSFRAKVGDFGLARPLHDISDTRTSRVVGTSGYIPPEYYRGTITTKMDSFAFGVVRDWKP